VCVTPPELPELRIHKRGWTEDLIFGNDTMTIVDVNVGGKKG
jgi:hypothetical protein